ncbi:MAG TPA: type VI secretion system baseplate subunit TssF, partial [Blastocatellia bacterium]|nr:type VI secretion system baseplate subunit TssF [Blastocatellia bacterium]
MRVSDREELLRYYKDELIYLRNRGSAFARQYPLVAAQLGIGAGESPDPQVERLIESFAFLAARIQHELDGEFPEITTALLGNLYPQLVNPIPSMAIAQFHVDPDQGKLTTGHLIERDTPLTAQTEQEITCRFKTCYPVTLWPLEVVSATFESPAQFDFLDSATRILTVLRLKLAPRGVKLSELDLRKLRFYLHGDRMLVNRLYELLMCHVLSVAVLPDENAPPICLPQDSISPVGFSLDEDVLPYPPNAHPGYRLLHEYFTFPEKFMFFEIDNLNRALTGEMLDLLVMLDRPPGNQICIDRETFVLGCTPVINLFRKTTEPIRLDHRQLEYPLIPDKRRERTTEIHSVISVTASSN